MLTIFVKILVLKKSHYVISQYKKMNKIYLIEDCLLLLIDLIENQLNT